MYVRGLCRLLLNCVEYEEAMNLCVEGGHAHVRAYVWGGGGPHPTYCICVMCWRPIVAAFAFAHSDTVEEPSRLVRACACACAYDVICVCVLQAISARWI